jgi:large subunit ribosomal protein L32
MSVPKHRKNKSRARTKRSHHAIKTTTVNFCVKCGYAIKPHTACSNCGDYKGRKVIATKEDVLIKRDDKRKKIEAKEKAKMQQLKNK